MIDQINVFESNSRVNELERCKIKINNESLLIRKRKIISIKLTFNKMKLYNVLFVFNLNVNLVSFIRIIINDFYVVYDDKLYTVIKQSNNQVMF